MPRTILLADDSLAVHRAVERAFAGRDDRLVVAANGDAAIEALEESRPDIVLADIHMPGASGYEVARQVKASSTEIPVLLLVGTFEPVEEERLAASGADGYVLKPFDGSELLERVDGLTGVEAPEPSVEVEASEAPVTGGEVESVAEEAGEVSKEDGSMGPVPETEPVATTEGAADDAGSDGRSADLAVSLEDADIERIARRVVELLTSEVVERLAREVVPEVAERAVRQRIEELERDAE